MFTCCTPVACVHQEIPVYREHSTQAGNSGVTAAPDFGETTRSLKSVTCHQELPALIWGVGANICQNRLLRKQLSHDLSFWIQFGKICCTYQKHQSLPGSRKVFFLSPKIRKFEQFLTDAPLATPLPCCLAYHLETSSLLCVIQKIAPFIMAVFRLHICHRFVKKKHCFVVNFETGLSSKYCLFSIICLSWPLQFQFPIAAERE